MRSPLPALLLLAAGACAGPSSPPPSAPPAPEASAGKPEKPDEPEATVLSELPAGGVMVFGLRAGAIDRASLLGELAAREPLTEIEEACEIDPFTDLEELAIAFDPESAPAGGEGGGDFVLAGDLELDRGQVEACLEALGREVERDGDVTVARDAGTVSYLTWSGGILLLAESEAVLERAGEGSGLAGNDAVMTYVERTDPEAALWGAGAVPESIRARFPSNAAPVGFAASIRASDEIDITVTMVLLGKEEAAELRAIIERALSQTAQDPMIAGIAEKLEIEQDGHELELRLTLTEQDVNKIQRLLSSLPVR